MEWIMKKVIMIRYAEMWLKGKNKGFFERAFENNLRREIKPFGCELIKQSGRYIVENFAWNPDSDGAKFIMKLLERKLS